MKEKKRFYFGWWILVVCFLMMFLQFSPSIQLSGLFVSPMAEEFGVSRTASSLSITIGILTSMGASLFAGKFLTKHSIRLTVCVSLFLYSVCYFLTALCNSVAALYAIWVARGILGSVLTTLPVSIILNNWFGKKMIGKMVSISLVGAGFGSMVLNPVTGWFIETHGWRSAYYFYTILPLVLIPLVALTFYRKPEDKGFERIGNLPEETTAEIDHSGVAAKDAVRTGGFWFSFAALTLIAGISQSWYNNGPSYLGSIGLDALSVSTVFSATAFGNMLGKLFLGAQCDRFGTKSGLMTGTGCAMAGYVLLILAGNSFLCYGGAALIGFGVAITTLASPLITSELFGRKDYGIIVGYLNIATSLGASLLPLVTSSIYDGGGSYLPAWYLLLGLGVLTFLFINIAYRKRRKN